jgi:hypothetical protein
MEAVSAMGAITHLYAGIPISDLDASINALAFAEPPDA